MKHLLEQAPSLRVKVPPPVGILLKKMPPYVGTLSAGNPKKAETSATQAGKAGERGKSARKLREGPEEAEMTL